MIMKKHEVPQDNENMNKGTKEIQYAIDENGKYIKVKSTGWEIKNDILRDAWNQVDKQTQTAAQLIISGKKSPLYFYMIKNQMDYKLLAEYAESFSFIIKRHCKPRIFNKLNQKQLKRYAEIFDISVIELKNIPKKIKNSIDKHTQK